LEDVVAAILGLIPSISILTVALLSVFTVGYFSKIGLHFLGVIDVSNLVYSFGLIFGVLTIFASFINGDTALWIRRLARDEDFLSFLVKAWNRVVLPSYVFFLFAHLLPKHPWNPTLFATDSFVFSVMVLAGLLLLAIIYTRHVAQNEILGAEVAGAIFIAVLAVYNGGRMQADIEASSTKSLYTVSLKAKAPVQKGSADQIKDVRIVRSSSNGFIVAIGGFISFIPKEEVAWIEAQTQVE
jgi:hypothetical protein